jgi:hypothetical protein
VTAPGVSRAMRKALAAAGGVVLALPLARPSAVQPTPRLALELQDYVAQIWPWSIC